MIWDSTVSIIVKVFSGIANLVFITVMARFLGPGNMGLFFIALTVITFAAIIGRLGMDNAVLRYTAECISDNHWPRIHVLYRRSIAVVAVVSILVALTLYLLSSWISSFIFSKPELSIPLQIMGFSVVPLSILYLHAEILKGLRKIRHALLLEGVYVPMIATSLLIMTWLVHGLSSRASSIIYAAIIYCIATVVSALISFYYWYREVPPYSSTEEGITTSEIIKRSIPMLWITIMNMVMGWADTLLLGILMDKGSVGRYAVVSRLAMLISFILIAVNNVLAPRFAELYASADYSDLDSLAKRSAIITTALAIPVTILFVLFPGYVLTIFGKGFAEASSALVILAIGQFVNVTTGSVGYLLMMSGHEKDYRNNLIIVTIINILLNWILILHYGIVGAATATACSVVALNILSAIFVYYRLSIITVPIPRVFYNGRTRA